MVKIFYDFYGREDYVDKFKDHSDYGALGEQESHLITFNLKESKERGFLLSPWVGGKMYSLYIFDKVGQKKELRPEAVAFMGALKVHPAGVPAEDKAAVAAAQSGKSSGSSAPLPKTEHEVKKETPVSGENEMARVENPSAHTGNPGTSGGSEPAKSQGGQEPKSVTAKTPGSPPMAGKQPAASGETPGNGGKSTAVGEKAAGKSGNEAGKGGSRAGSGGNSAGHVRPPVLLDFGKIPFTSEIDFATMTMAQYMGAISIAREGMRLIYGEMSPEEDKKFEAEWKPLFDYPCREVVDYVNQLNPLISLFLAIREAMGSEIEAYNAAALMVTIEAAE